MKKAPGLHDWTLQKASDAHLGIHWLCRNLFKDAPGRKGGDDFHKALYRKDDYRRFVAFDCKKDHLEVCLFNADNHNLTMPSNPSKDITPRKCRPILVDDGLQPE